MSSPSVFDHLTSNDREVEAATRAWLESRFESLEQPFDTLFKLFGAVQHRPEIQMDDGPFQAAIVYTRVAQHLWAAWGLTLTGHYIDAINTLKIVNESSLLALLFARDPEAAQRWEDGEKVRPYKVRQALSKHLAEEEADEEPLTRELGKSYGLVCDVAHPSANSIKWFQTGLRSFSATSYFDEARCAAVMVRLVDELALVIPGFAKVLLDAGCDIPRDHIVELLVVLKRIRSTFQPQQASA